MYAIKSLHPVSFCANIFHMSTDVHQRRTIGEQGMAEEKSKYFVLKQKAVPEVLLKVVEAKKLLDSEKVLTVQDATERVGISRSSFYKYKDCLLYTSRCV